MGSSSCREEQLTSMRNLSVTTCCLVLAAFSLSASAQLGQGHVGRVTDWSSHHLVVSGGPSTANLKAAKTEPRILFQLADRNLARLGNGEMKSSAAVPTPPIEQIDGGGDPTRPSNSSLMHRDW